MLAIHHIKSICAEGGTSPESTYMTLKFQGEDLDGVLNTEVVLYFNRPLRGQIAALVAAINRADEEADRAEPYEPAPTTPSGRPYDNDNIPF